VVSFTMTEPQFEEVTQVYKQMANTPELDFPDEHKLTLPLQSGKVTEVLYSSINSKFIEENIGKEKMIKISFPELAVHILITPRLMVQLPSVCIRKIGKFFSATSRVRVLDSILKSMEVILPEKDLGLDRVLKVLNLEDKESPIFFIHLTEGILSKLRKEAKVVENVPIIMASMILKQFKLEQEDKEKGEKKEELARDDLKKILSIFEESPKAYYLQELYHLREEENRHGKFAGSYDKVEFAQLVDKFLEMYTRVDEAAELPEEEAPEIIKLVDNESREMYIYRGYLVSLMERERLHAKEDISRALLVRWIKALENYVELPEMKRDDNLEKEVQKMIDQKYRLFKYAVMVPWLYNIFRIYGNNKEIGSKKGFYFMGKDKPLLYPFFAILEIKRAELYHEAFLSLPFVYRFFLTRFFLYFFQLFKRKKQEKPDSPAEGGGGSGSPDTQADVTEVKKTVQAKIRKHLPDLEKKYVQGGRTQETLDSLFEKWNNKVGEVRQVLKEKIEQEVVDRSTALYRMLLKSPDFTPEFLHKELRNIAIDLAQNKYTDVADKKALAQYIVLYSLSILRQRNR